MTDPPSVIIDANVAIAICVKDAGKFANAVAKSAEYAKAGYSATVSLFRPS